jgi:alpha-tubulin suppressor-like RCC1 family protein
VVLVSAGEQHSLALSVDGQVTAWGSNQYGESSVPSNLNDVVAIAAGGKHSVALQADGTVRSWGSLTKIPINLEPVVSIAAGNNFTVAITTRGTAHIWNDMVSWPITDASNCVALSAKGNSWMALQDNEIVIGGTIYGHSAFSFIQGATECPIVTAGDSFSMVLKSIRPVTVRRMPTSLNISEGHPMHIASPFQALAYQWRFNGHDLSGATNMYLVIDSIQTSQAGKYSVLAITPHDSVLSSETDVTISHVSPIITQQPVSNIFTTFLPITIEARAEGSLPITYQWQHNGEIIPDATNSTLIFNATRMDQSGSYSLIASNLYGWTVSSNTIVTLAPFFAWGTNSNGELFFPSDLTNVVAFAGGANQSLALKDDGTMVAWGSNSSGQGTVPQGLSNVLAIAAGGSHNLALLESGSVVAWGGNSLGQTNVPPGLTNVITLAAGANFSLALTANGTVKGWGENNYGQTRIPSGLSNVTAIAAGGWHGMALRSDRTILAWGYNGEKETNVPPGLTNVVAIAAGLNHSLALKADGTVTAWGWNNSGQTSVPAGLKKVVAIAANGYFSMALKDDGSVVTWGRVPPSPAGLSSMTFIAAGWNHCLTLLQDSVQTYYQNSFTSNNH